MKKRMEMEESVNNRIEGGDKKKMKKAISMGIIGLIASAMLLASPVLASAGYSKIYGNANEDDVLDMRDVTCIKLVIFGKKPATTLADANYDGKISMLDIGQTKLIILGKEKEITLVDQVDRVVTVPRPVERVVTLLPPVTRMVIGLGAADKLVGVSTWDQTFVINQEPSRGVGPKWDEVVGELKELPSVGSGYEPNQELILSLKPDVVIPYAGKGSLADFWNTFQDNTGIPVVGYRGSKGPIYDETLEQIELMGRVLGKEKRAEEIVSYFDEKLAKVTEVTSQIPDSEKPTVYFPSSWLGSTTKANPHYEAVELAGGILVFKLDSPIIHIEVSMEQVIDWNPDIFLVSKTSTTPSFTVEDLLSHPNLQTINAVKNRKVYYTLNAINLVGADHPRVITEAFYMAKLFHPEKFEDLDIEKEGNELFERFYGVGGLWTEIGGNLGFI